MTINAVYSKHAGKLHGNFSNSVCNLPKSHMHIFNVSIATVQCLKNVSVKVWEELITQSIYVGAVYSKHVGKMTKFNYLEIFRKISEHFQKVTCTSSMCP
jgi:hypothetical protein